MLAIPSELAQAVVDYLVQRPYREVHVLVPALLALPEISPAASTAEPDSDAVAADTDRG